MSSSSVQVVGEMSVGFARLGTCDRHMTKKWRGTAPPGECRAQVRETVPEGRPELMSIPHPKIAIRCRERLNCSAFRAFAAARSEMMKSNVPFGVPDSLAR